MDVGQLLRESPVGDSMSGFSPATSREVPIPTSRQPNCRDLSLVLPHPHGLRHPIPRTPAEQALVDDIQTRLKLLATRNITKINGFSFPDAFVLERGAFYDWQPLPKKYDRIRYQIPNGCYANAARLALDHPELTYVEGLAMSVIPLQHAWCVDAKGKVVDPTWRDNLGFTHKQRAYLGVPVRMSYYITHTAENNGSVIDNYQQEWPILKSKPEDYLPK